MSEQQGGGRPAGDGFREGVRSVAGLLGALKDAIEATVDDLRSGSTAPAGESSDSPGPPAREGSVAATASPQEFVRRAEFEALRREVAELRAMLTGSRAAAPLPADPDTPAERPGEPSANAAP